MICKGTGRRWSTPNRGTVPAFAWRDWRNSWKTSVRIASVPDGIRIRYSRI
jgi:hypothetical protein